VLYSGAVGGPVVLDGGLSTALGEQGADLAGALWTARLLGKEPNRLAQAHRA
jgi:homocysteine S-methyltransferase